MMADLCEVYAEAINKGKVPSVEDAWSYVCQSQCETALNEAQKLYENNIQKNIITKLPMTRKSIKEIMKQIKFEAVLKFKDKLIGEIPLEEYKTLKDLLKKTKKDIKMQIYNKSKEACENYFEQGFVNIATNIKTGKYNDCIDYQQGLIEFINNTPKEIREGPAYDLIKAEIVFNKTFENIKAMTEQVLGRQTNDIKLLTEKLKYAEENSLKYKDEALKAKEVYNKRLYDSEEALMKHKTSEVVIEERNKTLTSELERQRTKYNEELQEYKQKIKELETSIKDIKTSYETQLQTQKEDYTKKDVELTKTSALQEIGRAHV